MEETVEQWRERIKRESEESITRAKEVLARLSAQERKDVQFYYESREIGNWMESSRASDWSGINDSWKFKK